jgi:nucleotide-binding universal stress UspA family protein
MSGLKRILVASDLSPRADEALARAAQLATAHGATALTVLHILDTPSLKERVARQAAGEAEETLRQKIATLSLPRGIAVTAHAVTGRPPGEIPRWALEEKADLIVMAAHGEHRSSGKFLSTTAGQVVCRGSRAVLVAKKPTHGPYQRVLVAVDFSAGSRRALELALAVAPQAEFHVLHVYEPWSGRRAGVSEASELDAVRSRRQLATQARQRLEAFLGNVDCGRQLLWRVVRYGWAPEVIDTVARRLRAGLVAVGSVGRAGVPHIQLGHVAQQVLQDVECDVLVVRPDYFPFSALPIDVSVRGTGNCPHLLREMGSQEFP